MGGDLTVRTLVARGTKPVGGIYRIVSGEDCTIGAVVLDEEATREDDEAEGASGENLELGDDGESLDEDGGEDSGGDDAGANASARAAAYVKATVPKPVLAEANYLMRSLSDEDSTFMKKALLVGLERGGPAGGRAPGDLSRLASGGGA